MNRRLTRPLTPAVILAVLIAMSGAASNRADAATRWTAVQAQATEYRYGLSRTVIKPGTLRLELANYGEDEHDLAIRRVGTKYVRNVGRTEPGRRGVLRFSVKRGTYMLWCTISDHRARGMKATLRVRK